MGQLNSRLWRMGGTAVVVMVLSWVTWHPLTRAAMEARRTAPQDSVTQATSEQSISATVPLYHGTASYQGLGDPITNKEAIACILLMLAPVWLAILAPLLAIISGNVELRRPQLRVVGAPAEQTETRMHSGRRRHAVA